MKTGLRLACGLVLACTVVASAPAQTLDKNVLSLESAMRGGAFK
jgi:hypothetical protein